MDHPFVISEKKIGDDSVFCRGKGKFIKFNGEARRIVEGRKCM